MTTDSHETLPCICSGGYPEAPEAPEINRHTDAGLPYQPHQSFIELSAEDKERGRAGVAAARKALEAASIQPR